MDSFGAAPLPLFFPLRGVLMDPHYWALKRTDMPGNKIVAASGNWLAPLIFRSREQARKSAREFREYGTRVKPVRVKVSVSVSIVAQGK